MGASVRLANIIDESLGVCQSDPAMKSKILGAIKRKLSKADRVWVEAATKRLASALDNLRLIAPRILLFIAGSDWQTPSDSSVDVGEPNTGPHAERIIRRIS